MISFEPTVSAGLIGQTAILLAGIISGWIRLTAKLSSMEIDIRNLQTSSEGFSKSFEQLSRILTQVAVQDVRILNVEKDVDELRHHKGFVND